jgi:hypothetical protein
MDSSRLSKDVLIPCACGCGTMIPPFHSNGVPKRYVKWHYWKGKKRSDESKRKISLALMGRSSNPETNKKRSLTLKGRQFTEEHRNNLSIKAMSENNNMWKGDDVGYHALHVWVRKRLPEPKYCEFCEKRKPRDLANVTGVYNRALENWKYLCVSCHKKFDFRTGISPSGLFSSDS